MKTQSLLSIAALLVFTASATAQERVKIANGELAGTTEAGVRSFKGIPFGAPPVGNARWQPPQPVKNWTGVRQADKFGPRCMQRNVFGDMNFRANGTGEDCLYLNVWAPPKGNKLPVLVYFYGGGFIAGDGSEPRYDGASMAARGIVAVTVNYRLGVFGFFAHPELTKESPHHASGNYGLLDQQAALQWVQQNIAAFGGDPKHVTIAGESAGSISVSAQMASPLSKNLIAREENLDALFNDNTVVAAKSGKAELTASLKKLKDKSAVAKSHTDAGAYNVVFVKLKDSNAVDKHLKELNAAFKAAGAPARAVTWQQAIDQVTAAAQNGSNVMPAIVAAVEARATVGEVSDAMRRVFGEHHEITTA